MVFLRDAAYFQHIIHRQLLQESSELLVDFLPIPLFMVGLVPAFVRLSVR